MAKLILDDPMTSVLLTALYQGVACTHRATHGDKGQDPSERSLLVNGSRNHTENCDLLEGMDLERSEINRGWSLLSSDGGGGGCEITAISPCYGG